MPHLRQKSSPPALLADGAAGAAAAVGASRWLARSGSPAAGGGGWPCGKVGATEGAPGLGMALAKVAPQLAHTCVCGVVSARQKWQKFVPLIYGRPHDAQTVVLAGTGLPQYLQNTRRLPLVCPAGLLLDALHSPCSLSRPYRQNPTQSTSAPHPC